MATVALNQGKAYAFGLGAVLCWSTVATHGDVLGLKFANPEDVMWALVSTVI